jgi:Uma2 family endonuclease
MPILPDAAFIEISPDWVCEVLSPATAALDRTRKMRHYARAGVCHLWLLDPQPEALEVFRLDGDSWRLVTSVAGAVQIAAEPFDAIEMDLARICAR